MMVDVLILSFLFYVKLIVSVAKNLVEIYWSSCPLVFALTSILVLAGSNVLFQYSLRREYLKEIS